MTPLQPSLVTARLILRPFVLADAASMQKLAGEYEVADGTLSIPHPYPFGEAEAWISTHSDNYLLGREATWAITLSHNSELCGCMGISIRPQYNHAELGYWIGKPYWNCGYATEATLAVMQYGFATLNLHRIYARHFARNPASGRVMQKIGMSYEGCQREHILKGDRFEDLHLYGILKSEWLAKHHFYQS